MNQTTTDKKETPNCVDVPLATPTATTVVVPDDGQTAAAAVAGETNDDERKSLLLDLKMNSSSIIARRSMNRTSQQFTSMQSEIDSDSPPPNKKKKKKISCSVLFSVIVVCSIILFQRYHHHNSSDNNSSNHNRMNNNNNNNNNDEPNPPLWPDSVLIIHPPSSTTSKRREQKSLILQIKERIATQTNQDHQKHIAGGAYLPAKGGFNTVGSKGGEHNQETTYTSDNHFSNKRNVIFFAPGVYEDCDFEVGYYVQVAGLGVSATDVKFTGTSSGPFVEALNKELPVKGTIAYVGSGLSLDTFWRSAENFYISATEGLLWSVSQAAPLRRVYIDTNVRFTDGGGYASGGFMANAVVTGETDFGAQQQWFSRHVQFGGSVKGGAWNMVFSGCTGKGAPTISSIDQRNKATVVEATPMVRAEKPFVTIVSHTHTTFFSSSGLGGQHQTVLYKLRVPKSTRTFVTGPDLDGSRGGYDDDGDDDVRDFSRVKVGSPHSVTKDDTNYNTILAEDIELNDMLQKALDAGKDLVLSPGIYFLYQPLVIRHANQVLLGLGFATLVAPQDGSPCVKILPFVSGVRITSIMLEASPPNNTTSTTTRRSSSSLLEWGSSSSSSSSSSHDKDKDTGDVNNPGVMSDVCARVGGTNLDRTVTVDTMVRIHSGNVVVDNIWLWRADHSRLAPQETPNDPLLFHYHQTMGDECPVNTALEVNGDDVHMYGVFAEHTLQDLVVWNGDNGGVSFYQSELPYYISNKETYVENGYVGYRVGQQVQNHTARGIGVYSNFVSGQVDVPTAIRSPLGAVYNSNSNENSDTHQPENTLPLSSSSTSSKNNSNSNRKAGGIRFEYPFTVRLNSHGDNDDINGASIKSVINGHGPAAERTGVPNRVQ